MTTKSEDKKQATYKYKIKGPNPDIEAVEISTNSLAEFTKVRKELWLEMLGRTPPEF